MGLPEFGARTADQTIDTWRLSSLTERLHIASTQSLDERSSSMLFCEPAFARVARGMEVW